MAFLLLTPGFSTPCECGIDSGTVIVAGGGTTREEGHPILQAFIEALGGRDQPIVVFPTSQNLPEVINPEDYLIEFRALGFTNLTVMHTLDTAKANSEAFVQPLLHAKGVYLMGGRAYHYVNSYQGTRTVREIKNLVARGGVVLGTSAGAEIQSSTLVRGSPGNGANHIVVSMLPKYNVGFGLVPNTVFDAHINVRERWAQLYQPVRLDTNLLGLAASEGTAMVFQKHTMHVVGDSLVTVTTWDNIKGCGPRDSCYKTLRAGDSYDICARKQVVGIRNPPRIAASKPFLYAGASEGIFTLNQDLGRETAVLEFHSLQGERLLRKAFNAKSEKTFRHAFHRSGVVAVTLSVGKATYQQKLVLP